MKRETAAREVVSQDFEDAANCRMRLVREYQRRLGVLLGVRQAIREFVPAGKRNVHLHQHARDMSAKTDDAAEELAKRWIDEYPGQRTGFESRTPVDVESKGLWRELDNE